MSWARNSLLRVEVKEPTFEAGDQFGEAQAR